MQHHIDMDGLTTKPFVANTRHPGQDYQATIQNNTAQQLTITVTNENVLANGVAGAAFDAPAGGALVIATGTTGILSEPYVAWTLTLGGAGTAGETIDINEVG